MSFYPDDDPPSIPDLLVVALCFIAVLYACKVLF